MRRVGLLLAVALLCSSKPRMRPSIFKLKGHGWFCWSGTLDTGEGAFGCRRWRPDCARDLQSNLDTRDHWQAKPERCTFLKRAAMLSRKTPESKEREYIVLPHSSDCESLRALLLRDSLSEEVSECVLKR